MTDTEQFKLKAIEAAREAGQMLMAQIDHAVITGTTYENKLVAKTKQDDDSELLIVKILKDAFPNHNFLGEELTNLRTDSPYKWIIDPIDGTNNYLEGRDTFSVSIGLECEDRIILGVVYLPKRDELFVAELDHGATLNGGSISRHGRKDLSSAIVTFSVFPGSEHLFQREHARLKQDCPNLKDFGFESNGRVDPTFGRGSMAAEFCYLACGRIDGLVRLKQKPWDVAAGSLIAHEAGIAMADLQGNEPSVNDGDYIAGVDGVFDKLKSVMVPSNKPA